MTARLEQILFVGRDHPDEETRRTLAARGFNLIFAYSFKSALRQLTETRYATLILSLDEDAEAVSFLRRVRETDAMKEIPVLVLGEWGSGLPSLALAADADAYEPTPVNAEPLITSIERLLIKRGLAAGANE
jgi:DNA-binding response OmpR family regulator